jgi:hypothetical protein
MSRQNSGWTGPKRGKGDGGGYTFLTVQLTLLQVLFASDTQQIIAWSEETLEIASSAISRVVPQMAESS